MRDSQRFPHITLWPQHYHNTTFLIHEDDNEDQWGPKLGQFWPQTENISLKIKPLPQLPRPLKEFDRRLANGKWHLLDEPTAISLVADTCLACILALWPAGAFWFIHIHEMYYSHAKPIYKSFAFRLCCALMWTNLFCTPLMEHSSWVLVADLIIRVRLNLGQNIELTLYIKHSKIVSAEALKRPVLLCCQVFYGFENWIHYRWTNQAP